MGLVRPVIEALQADLGNNRRANAPVTSSGNTPVVVGVSNPANPALSVSADGDTGPAIVDAFPSGTATPAASSVPLPVNPPETQEYTLETLETPITPASQTNLAPSGGSPWSAAQAGAANGFQVTGLPASGAANQGVGINTNLLLVGVASLFMILKGGF